MGVPPPGVVYSQSETGRQTVLDREDTPDSDQFVVFFQLNVSWNVSLSGSVMCETFSSFLLLDEWQQAQLQKC